MSVVKTISASISKVKCEIEYRNSKLMKDQRVYIQDLNVFIFIVTLIPFKNI